MKYCFVILIVSISWCVYGQSGMGLIFDDDAYEKIPKQSMYRDGGKSEKDALTEISKVDLKPYCPKPKNQDSLSSCVAWASGYAALSIEHAFQMNWKNQQEKITQNAFSAMFLYNQIKTSNIHCKGGSKISDALSLMRSKGDIFSRDFDYNKLDCTIYPSSDDFENAKANRIKDFVRLFGLHDGNDLKVYKTKLSLVQNKPVIVGMTLLKNIYDVKTGDKYWHASFGDTTLIGGHAMVIVGFDEGRQAFEIMNSWGPYWGNKGFIWLRYKDFNKLCKYGFQLSIESVLKHVNYHGDFSIKYPNMVTRTLDTERVNFSNQQYLLSGKRKIGSKFQVVAEHLESGSHLYVFSIEPSGLINTHFPHEGESAVISSSNVKLSIPSPKKALQFNEIGNHYVCILSSSYAIDDFDGKIKQIQSENNISIGEKINQVFGINPTLKDRIIFSHRNISFNGFANDGEIIPVVLKIEIEAK